jgi:hypothetical protein
LVPAIQVAVDDSRWTATDTLFLIVISLPATLGIVADVLVLMKLRLSLNIGRIAVVITMLFAIALSGMITLETVNRKQPFGGEFYAQILGIPFVRAIWNVLYLAALKALANYRAKTARSAAEHA